MANLKELDKLENYLKEKGIKHERIDKNGRYDSFGMPVALERHQICVPEIDPDVREWDAICHYGSYGYDEGLLEIMGTLVTEKDSDSVVGYLTAEDVIKRIEESNYGRN